MGIGSALTSLIAGAVGGSFVLWGVNFQSRGQSEAACRALRLEVRGNYQALGEMLKISRREAPWEPGKPNPGWLNHSVWDSQLALIARMLPPRTLELVVAAYSTLEAIPDMRNNAGSGIPYSYGGWISQQVMRCYDAFVQANESLENFVIKFDPLSGLLPKPLIRVVRRLWPLKPMPANKSRA